MLAGGDWALDVDGTGTEVALAVAVGVAGTLLASDDVRDFRGTFAGVGGMTSSSWSST